MRGWNIGATVECFVNREDEDVVRIELTGGSSGDGSSRLIGIFKKEDLES